MSYRWVTIALLPACLLQAQNRLAHRRGSAERSAPPVTFDAAQINDPKPPPIAFGDKGSYVVRAQILLDRAHFSCGQIDGNFGTNLQKTSVAYQQSRNLPQIGTIDEATWTALNGDQAPLLTSYTIVPDDEKGPFVPSIPKSMVKAAELPFMGYASPLDELAERFHSSLALLQSLNPGADFSKPGQQLTVPNVLVMPPGEAAQVVVSKSESSVRAYDAEGKLLAFYVATIGSEHDPLPIGEWKINGRAFNPVFHYQAKLFWDAKDPKAKAVLRPGPRNPVGLVWIDLSMGHYGIHGTPDPSLIGHTFSHGCIRLTNWDALELASMVKPGTPAILKE